MKHTSCHDDALKAKPAKSQHSCCHSPDDTKSQNTTTQSYDYLLWGSLSLVFVFYGLALLPISIPLNWLELLSSAVFDLMNKMWWGILLGMLALGLLAKIPRDFVVSALGEGGTFKGILRATAAGVALDLCSHGILMVGAKLYERGASLGQVMAFLIASPWNSLSLTIILIALIGLGWTLIFIVASMIIAIFSGYLFDHLVLNKTLPENPNTPSINKSFNFWQETKTGLKRANFDKIFFTSLVSVGIRDSRMVLRWLLFGVLLASLLQTFISTEHFHEYFGPTLVGLFFSMIAATIIEVCSEGSTPIAADLVTRAQAPGNGFAFLMAGVSTDYTEIMVIKDTMSSWKIALFLPLITLPQIFVIALIFNMA